MPDPSVPPLGQIAIEWGLLTPQALAEAVDKQKALRSQGQHRHLGEVLVDSGYLSEEQVEELLLAQDLATTRGQERLFGDVAVQLGLITGDQLRDALVEQSVAWRFGRKRPLIGEILVERGWVAGHQVFDILEAQARGRLPEKSGESGDRAPNSPREFGALSPDSLSPGPGRRWAPFGLSVDDLVRLGRETGLHRHKAAPPEDRPPPPAPDTGTRPVPLSRLLEAGPLLPRRALEIAGQCARLLALRRQDGRPVARPVSQAILVLAQPTARLVAIDPPGPDDPTTASEDTLVRALGALLYECLTGVPLASPDRSDPPRKPARPGRYRRDLHPDVEAICLAALRGKSGGFRNTTELADEIDRYLDGRRLAGRSTLGAFLRRWRRR